MSNYENPFADDTPEHAVFNFLWDRYKETCRAAHNVFNSGVGRLHTFQPLSFNDLAMYGYLIQEAAAAVAYEQSSMVADRVIARYGGAPEK